MSPSEQAHEERRIISYLLFALTLVMSFVGIFTSAGPLLLVLGLATMVVGIAFYRRGK